jgi:hypothetical protein
MTWINTTTSSTTTTAYPFVVTSGSSTTYPYVITSGAGGGYVQPVAPSAPPAPRTALEWLDAEVERTCALARLKPAA